MSRPHLARVRRCAYFIVALAISGLSVQCSSGMDTREMFDDGDEIALRYIAAMPDVDAKDGDGLTPLIYAAQVGSAVAVRRLLERHASTDARDPYGFTPLQLAARQGAVAAVRELVYGGADLNARGGDADGTALDEAIIQNHPDVVRLLLLSGADVNAGDRWGQTGLHYLALVPPAASVMLPLLVSAQANVDAQDARGWAPIHVAASVDNFNFVAAVSLFNENLNVRALSGVTALDIALRNRADVSADALWRAGAAATSPTQLPALFEAAKLDEATRVENILAHGADVKKRFAEKTAFQIAVESGSTRVAPILAAAEAGK